MRKVDRRLLALFAEALDYPEDGIAETARECEQAARDDAPVAVVPLAEFAAFVAERPLGELQELYTAAFDLDTLSDLDATCYPYVGHHLFGESHKRSAFLVGLAERFRAHGFTVERELPDHLVVLLRFAAACPDEELVGELVDEALLPALERMTGGAEAIEGPQSRRVYLQVLLGLRLTLEAAEQAHAPPLPAGGRA